MQFPTFKTERKYLENGFDYVAGCDEVGVGPLAGPVVAAVCILDPNSIKGYRTKNKWFYRVRDSKTVNENQREALAQEIKEHCLAYGIGEVDVQTIDQINIHQASMLAMKKAFDRMRESTILKSKKICLLLDGRFVIKELTSDNIFQTAVIDGDASIISISAASLIAKVYRDNILKQLDAQLPMYQFAKHKGYNTKEHSEAIIKYGLTPYHRRSFLKSFDLQKI